MILYFADRHMNLLGLASTELPRGLTITEDLKTEEVASGVATFSCRVLYDADNRASVETCVQAGNYILRSADGENEFYTIIETESDTRDQTVYLYAEDAGLDLLNEVAGADQITEPHDVAWYVQRYTYDSGFELGVNEVQPDSVRTLSWEGEQTVTERLASIATQFGNFEVSYSFAVEGLVVTHKYINLYRKRGTETGVQLRLNREVDRIITKKSVANLATALLVTGGTPEEAEDPITLEGYVYDDGDFYVDGKYLKSRNAVAKWSRYVWAKEPNRLEGYQGHIVQTYSYDTTSQQTLCAHAITALKKLCDLEVNYEVELTGLPDNVRIGDTVEIVDEQGQLYLSARVLKLETSITERRKTATFGEYLLQEDGIAQRVAELAAKFLELSKEKPDAVTQITTYYALGTSSTEPPSDPAGGSVGGGAIVGTATVGTAIVGQSSSDSEVKTKAATVATVGSAIVGQALVGSVMLSSGWTTERLTAQDGEYLWTAGLVEYLDGTTTWTTPTCLTDGLVREKTTTLQTALNVVQGQISSKVWQTDIISAVDPLGQEINILQDQYTTLTQTMDGLQVKVGDLTTTVSENYRELDSKLAEISVTAEGLSTQVSSVQTAIDGVQTTTETLSSRIEQLADSITLSVSGSLGGTASIVLSVDGQATSKSLDLSQVRAAFANDESAVTISAGTVAFGANTLIVNSSNFTLDQNGNVSVAGTITAQSGSIIGDWGITSGKIFATSPVYQNTDGKYPVAAMQVPGGMDGTANWVFAAGGTSHDNYTDCPFRVSKDGVAYVQKLNIPYDTDASGGYATIRAQNYGDGAGLKIDCSFILDVGNYIRCNLPYGDFILQEAILGVTSDSNLSIGAGIPAHSIDDNSGNTHIHGRWIKLICGTEGEGQVQLIKERTGDLRTVFRPASNGGAYLGTSSYRWASVYCSDGAFNGSDRKLKDHIAYLDEVEKVEDFVMALRPVEYTLKSGTGKRTHMGLYAQDVAQAARSTIGDLAAYQAARRGPGEEELPYTQDIPDDELDWSLNYSELIAPLIAVIQKQSHKLMELEERINGIGGNKVS